MQEELKKVYERIQANRLKRTDILGVQMFPPAHRVEWDECHIEFLVGKLIKASEFGEKPATGLEQFNSQYCIMAQQYKQEEEKREHILSYARKFAEQHIGKFGKVQADLELRVSYGRRDYTVRMTFEPRQ